MKLTCMRRLSGILAMLLTLGAALTSCDSAIYDDQGDCTVHYRVKFRYSKNVLDADAFGSQVTDVNLYLYDKQGNLVCHKSQARALTSDNDYYIEVDVLPGNYDMIAWCEGKSVIKDAESFGISEDAELMTSLGAKLPLKGNGGDGLYSNSDINRFYHGMLENVNFPDSYGVVDIAPIELTKDTNHILVQLQNVGNEPLDESIISVELEGENSSLDYKNELVGSTVFKYEPWSYTGTSLSYGSENESRASLVQNGFQAELTTGRIMADKEQKLTVRRADTDEIIFSIPLVEYLLLVRGEYEKATSNQDYLDRCDDYTLVFFIQDGYTWMKTKVLINGWRRVPPQNSGM